MELLSATADQFVLVHISALDIYVVVDQRGHMCDYQPFELAAEFVP